MKRRLLFLFIGALLTGITAMAHGSVITSHAEYLRTETEGEYWRYDYTVENNSLGVPLTEFFVDFDYGLYDLLSAGSTTGWFTQSADPSATFTGFYNAQTLGAGIAPGGIEGGFSVEFLWLNPGAAPADQTFLAIGIDGTMESGRTTDASPVPEPATFLMLVIGLLVVAICLKHKSRIVDRPLL